MTDQAPDLSEIRAALFQAEDVLRVLLEQHQRILDLLTGVRAASGDARIVALRELRALFVVHETAEQIIVHPRSGEFIGANFADQTALIERQLAQELANLEDVPPGHGQFDENLDVIEGSVLDHFYVEESQEFPVLLAEVPLEERLTMGRRLLRAQKVVPTRPHPGVDSVGPAATLLAAPLTSLIDRTRDAIERESS